MPEVYASLGLRGTGPMGKAMSIAGLVVGGVLALAFALDLVLGVPFGGKVPLMNVGFLVCGLILAYLGWSAFRDAV